MPNQASFPLAAIQPLLDELEQAESYSPSMESLFNPAYYPDGRVVNKEGLTEAEVKAASDDPDRELFWPDHTQMDKDKVKPEFWIVKDQGMYLMTNAAVDLSEDQSHPLIYANGCNPDIDVDDWYYRCHEIFGGDDGVVPIPVDWVKWCIANHRKSLTVRFNKNSIRLV